METTYQSRPSKREIFFHHNSLLCLLKALEKRYTTIDLRNENCATGKLAEVDGYMNVTLHDAALYDSDGSYQYFPMLHIQARNIRNVHIPDDISITKAIKSQIVKEPKKLDKKKMTFKQSRMKKQQKETLKLIEEMKNQKKKERSSGKTEEANE